MEHFIAGIGDILWDCFPEGRKIGGAPANFAYYMKQFGFESLMISAVGEDELGAEIHETLDRIGLDHVLQTVDYPTGSVMIELDENGIPTYRIIENVSYDNISYTEQIDQIAKKCTVLCFGTLAQRNSVSRDSIRRFLQAMPQTDETYKVFDINLRQNFYDKDIVAESLRLCNVFKVNDEELAVVKDMFGYSGDDDQEVCRQILSDWDLKYLILTCGTSGSYVYADGEESFLPTPEVEVADTVGAGDSFIGTFMALILKGATVQEAHKLAVAVSAYVCTQYGGMCQILGQ
jgi:fructokinase